MGDAGALFLGIIMASLLIRFEPGTTTTFGSFATPLLLLAVPILDTSVAVISRISRKTSPFSGAKDHLSHRLIRAGLSQKSTVTALWLLSLLFSLLAIALSYDLLFGENILVFFAMFTWILLLIYFLKTEHA
jgi:UDP-GlcNAc:undecaprenyl-phosphate GlcNAc-1-phosphate transferase